ncbi:hypothetical protein E5288_WYG011151 [Bos mutus]|uniref:Very-long-chain (3R)-3-hydroxyacyl-CoA dehydratase n=1 Tax=Bos mutus TaxID=72004 RepID=A0A6B0RNX4_9CETA|nr:hypothetical protein [Bos mutus]
MFTPIDTLPLADCLIALSLTCFGDRWLVIAVGLVRAYLAKGSYHSLYYSIEKPLKFFQTGALLEILHCAIGNEKLKLPALPWKFSYKYFLIIGTSFKSKVSPAKLEIPSSNRVNSIEPKSESLAKEFLGFSRAVVLFLENERLEFPYPAKRGHWSFSCSLQNPLSVELQLRVFQIVMLHLCSTLPSVAELINWYQMSVPQVQSEDSVLLFVIAWTITEIIRYSFYTFSLLNHLPYLIKWARYTLFIVLYPMGVSGELLTIYAALPFVRQAGLYSISLPNKYNFSFDYYAFLILIMISYIPLFPQLYFHMIHQRRKILSHTEEHKKFE